MDFESPCLFSHAKHYFKVNIWPFKSLRIRACIGVLKTMWINWHNRIAQGIWQWWTRFPFRSQAKMKTAGLLPHLKEKFHDGQKTPLFVWFRWHPCWKFDHTFSCPLGIGFAEKTLGSVLRTHWKHRQWLKILLRLVNILKQQGQTLFWFAVVAQNLINSNRFWMDFQKKHIFRAMAFILRPGKARFRCLIEEVKKALLEPKNSCWMGFSPFWWCWYDRDAVVKRLGVKILGTWLCFTGCAPGGTFNPLRGVSVFWTC